MTDRLDALYRQHHTELRTLAYRRVGRHDVAADVVQEAFIRYADMANTADGSRIDCPKSFLCRIVINLAADVGRRDRRRGEHAVLEDMANHLADPQPSPEAALESRQRMARLRNALDDLPESCRASLLLSRVDGMTHAEVADRLGVSSSMVSKHIMRAIRHCQRCHKAH
ncbi:RNA polymerase sigma factor [Skermanella stibiiresistens SB22]|uniref:RNA polymerase sigma factor n=1 Tax=Skermanella stibiiresistens SB22 TaxID=1385369 RepID=W9H0S4_9PROT|nr:sigma-70 family RNA polymerase sigma factor [Skermanella stibiiresistens]EWY39639.1 RNA polymerase sigma factor [Skermanella stibiiresistens SB22]